MFKKIENNQQLPQVYKESAKLYASFYMYQIISQYNVSRKKSSPFQSSAENEKTILNSLCALSLG